MERFAILLRLRFYVRPAKNTGTVFTDQAVEREIKNQQHPKKYQDFHCAPLRRILHESRPTTFSFLANGFGFFDLSQFIRGQVDPKSVAAIAAAQALASTPVVNEIDPGFFTGRASVLATALGTSHLLAKPCAEIFEAVSRLGAKERSSIAKVPSART